MASSTDSKVRLAAVSELGSFLAATEASGMAALLGTGAALSSALSAVPPGRRSRVEQLVTTAGLQRERERLVDVLIAVAAARRATSTRIDPVWTMPGHLAQSSPLTSSLPDLVLSATTSVVCSTFNFAESSGLWDALAEVSQRPAVHVRLYVDTAAAKSHGLWQSPSVSAIATHLKPGRVFRTRCFDGKQVRNHAKLAVVDSRFLLVTSANFSWSAAYRNVEFGVKIDNVGLAESVERELRGVEGVLYERVEP